MTARYETPLSEAVKETTSSLVLGSGTSCQWSLHTATESHIEISKQLESMVAEPLKNLENKVETRFTEMETRFMKLESCVAEMNNRLVRLEENSLPRSVGRRQDGLSVELVPGDEGECPITLQLLSGYNSIRDSMQNVPPGSKGEVEDYAEYEHARQYLFNFNSIQD